MWNRLKAILADRKLLLGVIKEEILAIKENDYVAAARVIGGMLHYDVTVDPQSKAVSVSNVRFETIVTHYVSGSHDVQIYPLSQYTDTLAKRQASRIKQSDFSVAYIEDFVRDVIPAEFLAA